MFACCTVDIMMAVSVSVSIDFTDVILVSEDTYGDDECDENFEDDEGDEDVKAYLCPKKG